MKGYITFKIAGLIPRDSFEAFLTCDKHLHAQPLHRLCQICVFLFVTRGREFLCVQKVMLPDSGVVASKAGVKLRQNKDYDARSYSERNPHVKRLHRHRMRLISYNDLPAQTACLEPTRTGTERNCSLMSKMLSRWAAPLHNRLVCIYLLIIRLIMYVCMHKKKCMYSQ